ITSLLLALTWTPTLSQYLVRRSPVPSARSAIEAESASPAAGETPITGFFARIIALYSQVMQSILKRPVLLGTSLVGIVALSFVSYQLLETELLPKMDEGGFILDYFTPPGSSLSESNRILLHIEEILRAMPDVENTSRRTGLQLGLAAVTEANRGDFTVKLKPRGLRSRSVFEVIADVRDRIEASEPATKVEFVQILQDMIGDLSNEPQPVVIRLYSQDGKLLNET